MIATMNHKPRLSLIVSALLPLTGCQQATERSISLAEYQEKVYASWMGQCIGNMYGLPHEFKYNETPRTEPIEGWMPQAIERITEADGAFSDDDTDIEYVDLFCMEKYGPEPTYEQLTEFWKRCINNYIWVANRSARDLMEKGYFPPHTGRRGINPNWYQIDPQLVCEIWAVTAPGMIDYAAAKADWAARVTNDDYGTHPTIWYNAMYAAGFFETDVEKLCQIGYEQVPEGSIFRTAIDDVRRWKAEHGDDWVAVRNKINAKYIEKEGLPEGIATGPVSALVNGTLGVLALLYGEGDFDKTVNMACMAGYDADNQCATLAGLIALTRGSSVIARKYTHILPGWTEPLNNFYKNRTRDNLPDGTITDIARRTADMGVRLVLAKGGRIDETPAGRMLVIPTAAKFVAPLEVRLFPVQVYIGEPAEILPEIIGGTGGRVTVTLAGAMPPGMRLDRTKGGMGVVGTPTQTGRFEVSVSASNDTTRRQITLPIVIAAKNLASSADKVLAAITKPTGTGDRNLNVLRNGLANKKHYDSFDGKTPIRDEDFYGYLWAQPVEIGRLVFRSGPVFPNGGWFETLEVMYRNEQNRWTRVEDLVVDPPYTPENARKGDTTFTLTFKPVKTVSIRIIGKPGGEAGFTSIAELQAFRQ